MDCRESRDLLSPFIDDQLNIEEKNRLLEHLEGCASCRCDLAQLEKVLFAVRQMGKQELQAPEGFSKAVIARIEKDRAATRVSRQRIKQAAMGAAAAVLLAAGSMMYLPGRVVQIADQPAQHDNIVNSQPDTLSSTPQSSSGQMDNVQGQTDAPATPDDQSPIDTAPETNYSGSPAGSQSENNLRFAADENHVIVSTFLKIKVDDNQTAQQALKNLTGNYGAGTQSLGQQSQGGSVCLVNNITVKSSRAAALISDLKALGTLVSLDEKTVDLNERYSELYSQLIALQSQKAQTPNGTQAGSLDRQIKEIEKQLQSWDEQSGNQTIIVWLQQ